MAFTNLILFQRCFFFFFFPPAALAFFFFHQHLPQPPPSFSSSLPFLFFSMPLPSPHHFPRAFSAQIFLSLLPSLSVLPFLSLMGSPANTSPSLALLSTISSLIAVKLMKWSTGVTPFPPLRFLYLQYLHLFAPPSPFLFQNIFIISVSLLSPLPPTPRLYFSWF